MLIFVYDMLIFVYFCVHRFTFLNPEARRLACYHFVCLVFFQFLVHIIFTDFFMHTSYVLHTCLFTNSFIYDNMLIFVYFCVHRFTSASILKSMITS